MSSWIDLHALARIVLIGLLCGAGLPAVFAVGLKALSLGPAESSGVSVPGAAPTTRRPLGVALATVCFAVVLAAVGWGIYLVVAGT